MVGAGFPAWWGLVRGGAQGGRAGFICATLTRNSIFQIRVAEINSCLLTEIHENSPWEEPIYYNDPDDDELFVRRHGMNVPNFGNRSLWILLGILVSTTLLITLLAALVG